MSIGLRKPRVIKKAQPKKTYRGFDSRVSRVIVDILYKEQKDIVYAYTKLDHNYSSIARILQEENKFALAKATPGANAKAVVIQNYHIKRFLTILGVTKEASHPPKKMLNNNQKSELIDRLKAEEINIFRKSQTKTVFALAKEYNTTSYWISKVLKNELHQ